MVGRHLLCPRMAQCRLIVDFVAKWQSYLLAYVFLCHAVGFLDVYVTPEQVAYYLQLEKQLV